MKRNSIIILNLDPADQDLNKRLRYNIEKSGYRVIEDYPTDKIEDAVVIVYEKK